MARTHKTAIIKQQMADEAAAREAAEAAAAVDRAGGKAASVKAAHREAVHSARTRSEKADAIQRARNDCAETEAEEDTELEEKPAATSVVIDTSEASEGGEEHEEVSTGAEDDGADAELESDGGSSSSVGRKRKQRPTLHVDEDMLATVPPFTERHRSWAEFTQAFDVYKAATNQVLVVKEVINVARRNNSLRNQVQYQGLPDDEIPLVPTTLDPSQRKYICTHGWPARERSSGKRTSHHVRRTDCPFQLIAQWAQSADESWVIVPKRAVYTHNHQVSTGIYQQYPGIRQVPSQSPLVPGVRLLMQTQAGPSSIYEYIRENSDHHVTMQDVRNLVARLRNSGAELSDDDAVAERIVNFNVESPMNVSSVHESARGNTGVISITTGHMRAMVESFPEVLQMDCTHKTNKYNYQLLSMVAMDQYCCGQPVQYSLLETNADWHMAKCLDHFKRANDSWRLVRIVIVDKDMREVEVIRQKLPEARVLLCHFHVIKWLHETIRKSSKYGPYEAAVLNQLRHTITNMTYARSDEVYEEHRAEFKSLSMRGGRQELWDYFEKNWDNCKDTWVMAYRMELPHFNNHTNNRVESLFSKVKQHLKGHITMNASLEALLYQRRKKEEYYAKVEMPGTLRDFTYSEEMNIVLGMTTKWVAAAIRSQYVAVDPVIVSSYTVVDNGPTVTLRNEDHECLLQKETFKCDCEFSQTMQLPCRHAMIWRKSRGGPFVVPFGAIGSRWYGRSRLSTQGLSKVAKPFVAKVFKGDDAAISRDRTEKEKFRRAQQAFGRISGELARLGDEAFDAAMDQFEGWWHNLRQGQISMTPCHEQTENRDNDGSNDGGNACGGENAEDTSSVAQAISGGGGSPSSGESEDLPITQQTAVSTRLVRKPDVPVKIKLNSRIVPVGRPRLNRKEQRAKAKADLKEYNQGMKPRGLLRDRDVCEVVSALKAIQPGILEMGAFLATFQVLGKATPKLSTAWRHRTDIVADNVRYRLPEETVNRAFKLLSESRTGKKDEIQLDSDGEGVGDENGYVLVVEKVGTYSREQVEQMKWMWNMQDTCRRGVLLCTWLNNEVKTLVDEKVAVSVAFDNFLKTWPYLVIPGFGFDIIYADSEVSEVQLGSTTPLGVSSVYF